MNNSKTRLLCECEREIMFKGEREEEEKEGEEKRTVEEEESEGEQMGRYLIRAI